MTFLVTGAAGFIGYHIAQRLLERGDADLIICGEGPEWETPEYVREANRLGRSCGLIVLGHAVLEIQPCVGVGRKPGGGHGCGAFDLYKGFLDTALKWRENLHLDLAEPKARQSYCPVHLERKRTASQSIAGLPDRNRTGKRQHPAEREEAVDA